MRARAPGESTRYAKGNSRVNGARTIQVYMPEELFEAVRAYANEDGRTIGGQFRFMAQFYLNAIAEGGTP